MIGARRFLPALLLAVGLAAVAAAPVDAGAVTPPHSARAATEGVSRAVVVVDFGDGRVVSRSITFDGTISGLAALKLAGFTVTALEYGGGKGAAVCGVGTDQGDQIGCAATSSCLTCQQPRYWAYFHDRAYAASGASGAQVGDCTVEAWRWGTSAAVPAGLPTRAQICPPPPSTTTTRPPVVTVPPASRPPAGPVTVPPGPAATAPSPGSPSGGPPVSATPSDPGLSPPPAAPGPDGGSSASPTTAGTGPGAVPGSSTTAPARSGLAAGRSTTTSTTEPTEGGSRGDRVEMAQAASASATNAGPGPGPGAGGGGVAAGWSAAALAGVLALFAVLIVRARRRGAGATAG